jgi:hypothetical protein
VAETEVDVSSLQSVVVGGWSKTVDRKEAGGVAEREERGWRWQQLVYHLRRWRQRGGRMR